MILNRYGQIAEQKRCKPYLESSHRYEKYDTKIRQSESPQIEQKVTHVKNNGNADDLGNSRQTSKYTDKINAKRTQPNSKSCRLSKYLDFLQTPLSTLERSLSKKKGSDTVKNDKKEDEILTSAQDNQTKSVEKDNGTYLNI